MTSVDTVSDVGAVSVTVIKSSQYNLVRHFINIFKAWKIINKIQPICIFSTGGPICIPFAVVAKLTGVKFVYLDTLSRVQELSNTAKFLYRYNLTSVMYCQWEEVAKKYPRIEYHGKTFNICNSGD